MAYSAWTLTHEPDWYGMLTIAGTPVRNRYTLNLRVETVSTADSSEWQSREQRTPIPSTNVVTPRVVPMNPSLTPQEMAECLASNPPAACLAPE
jgi:hypothetical protein